MKGFIKITRPNGDILLINIANIRTVKPSLEGCAISLDIPFIPKGFGGSFNSDNSFNNISIAYQYENMAIIAKEGFEDVCSLIEAAQS